MLYRSHFGYFCPVNGDIIKSTYKSKDDLNGMKVRGRDPRINFRIVCFLSAFGQRFSKNWLYLFADPVSKDFNFWLIC